MSHENTRWTVCLWDHSIIAWCIHSRTWMPGPESRMCPAMHLSFDFWMLYLWFASVMGIPSTLLSRSSLWFFEKYDQIENGPLGRFSASPPREERWESVLVCLGLCLLCNHSDIWHEDWATTELTHAWYSDLVTLFRPFVVYDKITCLLPIQFIFQLRTGAVDKASITWFVRVPW